jgi:hypothetical protein
VQEIALASTSGPLFHAPGAGGAGGEIRFRFTHGGPAGASAEWTQEQGNLLVKIVPELEWVVENHLPELMEEMK